MRLRAWPGVPGRAVGELHGAGPRSGPAERPGILLLAPGADPSEAGLAGPLIGVIRSLPAGSEPGLRGLAGPPEVWTDEGELLREGDRVLLDGAEGRLELPEVTERPVVTAFLQRADGRVLLLRRSEAVGSFRGLWAGVSGRIEDVPPLEQALREIREETGVGPEDALLVGRGEPFGVRWGATIYRVHPFRFRVPEVRITLDWEHREADWVEPDRMLERPTVPELHRAWRSVRPELRKH